MVSIWMPIQRINSHQNSEDRPELIALKVKITIEGFVQSINHRMFAFKNLEPSEDVYELRRTGKQFSMIAGDLQKEVEDYLERFPQSTHVYKAAGDYYRDVLYRYGDQLEEYSHEDLYRLIADNYEQAHRFGARQIEDIANVGEYSLRLGDLEKSIEYYSIVLKEFPRNASYNYNISIAYQNRGEMETAASHSQIAIEEYEDPRFVADSYHINAFQKENSGKVEEALVHYRKALELNPALYYSQKNLTNLQLKTGQFEEAERSCRTFLMRNIRDFQRLREIIGLFFAHQEVPRIKAVVAEMARSAEAQMDAGTLYYHLGVIQNSIGEDPRESILTARNKYLEVLDEDEGIIQHIDEFLGELNS